MARFFGSYLAALGTDTTATVQAHERGNTDEDDESPNKEPFLHRKPHDLNH